MKTYRCVFLLSWALCAWLLLALSLLRWHEGKEVYFHSSGNFVYGIVRRLRSACCRLYLLDHPSVNATPPVGGQIAPLLHHHLSQRLFFSFSPRPLLLPLDPSHCSLQLTVSHTTADASTCTVKHRSQQSVDISENINKTKIYLKSIS